MLQFYFLSVFFNALAGYFFFFGEEGARKLHIDFFSGEETWKLVFGILSAVTGLLKLLSPIEGDLPVIGDLVPAISGIACGIILIFEYYRHRTSVEDTEQTIKIKRIFIDNKNIIGAGAMIAAVLHFLFPRVLFL